MKVAFATKTWAKDWKTMLAGGFERKWQAIGYPFEKKILLINNGVPDTASDALRGKYDCYDVKFIIPTVCHFWHIGKELSIYAQGELSAIWISESTSYLCYVQGDCQTEGGDWVTPGIKVLESEPNVMVVSPASEVNTWADKGGYDHYMSDQAFLVRAKDFQNPEVYQVEGVDPDYPSYGGNSFEHMVGKYLKQSGRTRKILPEFWTIHGVT